MKKSVVFSVLVLTAFASGREARADTLLDASCTTHKGGVVWGHGPSKGEALADLLAQAAALGGCADAPTYYSDADDGQ